MGLRIPSTYHLQVIVTITLGGQHLHWFTAHIFIYSLIMNTCLMLYCNAACLQTDVLGFQFQHICLHAFVG
jgi:hypothetical protein